MIKFFRHIRKSLIQENNMGNYFKYALGEILLVVVGILIALQINTWNESKKAREFEVKMLNELKSTLNSDLDYIQRHLLGNRNQREVDAVVYFKDLLRNKERDKDSLRYYWDGLIYGQYFRMNLGPYESLKSIGVDKISNDSLRFQIVYFYDFIFPRNRDLIQNVQDGVDYDDLHRLMEPMTYGVVDNNVLIDRPTPDLDVIYKPEFLEVLRRTDFRTSWTISHTNVIIDELQFLLKQINKELEK